MSKRSTNLNGGKKPIKGSHVLDLMRWVGMTDEEIKAALERAQKRARPIDTDSHDDYGVCVECDALITRHHTDPLPTVCADCRFRPLPMTGTDYHVFGEE